jgi:hypothetical protein
VSAHRYPAAAWCARRDSGAGAPAKWKGLRGAASLSVESWKLKGHEVEMKEEAPPDRPFSASRSYTCRQYFTLLRANP